MARARFDALRIHERRPEIGMRESGIGWNVDDAEIQLTRIRYGIRPSERSLGCSRLGERRVLLARAGGAQQRKQSKRKSSHRTLDREVGDDAHWPLPPPPPLSPPPLPPMPSRLRETISATTAAVMPRANMAVRGFDRSRSYLLATPLRGSGTDSPVHSL